MFRIVDSKTNKTIFSYDHLSDGEHFAITTDQKVLIINASGNYKDVSQRFRAEPIRVPTKEQFIQLIEGIKKIHEKEEKINQVLTEVFTDSYLCFPTLEHELCEYLSQAFHDEHHLIYYFIIDLDFGKSWNSGNLTDKAGSDLMLKTAADLYDLLIKK